MRIKDPLPYQLAFLKYPTKLPLTEIENLEPVRQVLIQSIKIFGNFKENSTSKINFQSKESNVFADQF